MRKERKRGCTRLKGLTLKKQLQLNRVLFSLKLQETFTFFYIPDSDEIMLEKSPNVALIVVCTLVLVVIVIFSMCFVHLPCLGVWTKKIEGKNIFAQQRL